MYAYYKFRFYELDQPLRVGDITECHFFLDPHFCNADNPIVTEGMTLVFHNTLAGPESISAICKIVEIWHPELGQIKHIDTKGFDYRLTLEDGSVIELNAEEESGRCYELANQPSDWSFIVSLETQAAQQDAAADAADL